MYALLIAAFIAAYLLTGLLRHYALQRGIIDMPNLRSSHAIPTPRGGGLSFVLVFFAALTAMLTLQSMRWNIDVNALWALFSGGGLAALIGFIDDHGHVPARWRFLTHLAAAALALYFLGMPWGWFAAVFIVLALTWLLNLFNFMDGIDAIAAVEALSVLLGAALIAAFETPNAPSVFLWLWLAAGVGGFLVWNRPPAKIFMGDAASGFLGLTLGLFALISVQDGTLNLACWLILLGCFIVDATYTLLQRMWRGERWYEAHRSHAYQKMAARLALLKQAQGFNAEQSRALAHRNTVAAMAAINGLWLLPLAWAAVVYPNFAPLWVAAAWLPLLFIAIKARAGIAE
ncbi:MAG: MraY family glycosyltransferase [Gammaproteobacteria bacterium]